MGTAYWWLDRSSCVFEGFLLLRVSLRRSLCPSFVFPLSLLLLLRSFASVAVPPLRCRGARETEPRRLPGRAEVASQGRPGCSRQAGDGGPAGQGRGRPAMAPRLLTGAEKDSRRGVAVQARARRKAAQNYLLNLLVVARSAICSSASIAVSFSFVSVTVPPFCVRGPRGGHSVSPAVPVVAAGLCFFAS